MEFHSVRTPRTCDAEGQFILWIRRIAHPFTGPEHSVPDKAFNLCDMLRIRN
jgi:hypothetical protein